MDLYDFDDSYRLKGFSLIAGIDEAGRGPLAGPVVSAVVILPKDLRIEGLKDSKELSAKERERLYSVLCQEAQAYAIGIASVEEIDRLNILEATRLAMTRAVEALPIQPDLLIIDALRLPMLKLRQESVIKADSKSASVASASILAKVTRDRLMMELHKEYPQYGFNRHKGYPTRSHREFIAAFGPSPVHRKTFRLF